MRLFIVFSALLATFTPCFGFDRPFVFGTQVLDEGRLEEMLVELQKRGATQSRVGVCWYNNEKVRGQKYDFSETDKQVDIHLKYGFSVLLNLATVPEWASEVPPEAVRILKERKHDNLIGTFMVSPNYLEDYTRWVEAVAKHFGDRIDYYEIWNEPDGMAGPIIHYGDSNEIRDVWYGGDPEAFTRVLKAAYTALHKYDPGCTVVACSLESKTAFLKGIYEAGGKGYFDAVSIHPYGEPLNRRWIKEIRDLMVEWGDGDKGIWVVEYGWGFGDKPGLLKEAIRWGRETPYLTALHVHLANYLFENRKVGEGPLKPTPGLIAFEEAVQETGPANQRKYDFEDGLPVDWRFSSDQQEGAEFSVVAGIGNRAGAVLRGTTAGKSLSLSCNVYVKDHHSKLVFWSYIPSDIPDKQVRLKVIATPASPIWGVDASRILSEDYGPFNQWTKHEVKLIDISPRLAGSTLMNLAIELSSESPGISLAIDDFEIVTTLGPAPAQSKPVGALKVTVNNYVGKVLSAANVVLVDSKGMTQSLPSDEAGVFESGSIVPGVYRLRVSCARHKTHEQKVNVFADSVKIVNVCLNPIFNMVQNPSFEQKGWGGPKRNQKGVGIYWETVCGGPHPEIYEITNIAGHSGRSQKMTCVGYNCDFGSDPPRCFHFMENRGKQYHLVPGIVLGNQAIAQVIQTPVNPGEEYQLSAWVKILRLTARWEWFRLSIYWLDKDGRFIGESRESEEDRRNIDSHDWKLITVRGVAPPGAVRGKIYLHHHFEHGTVWYDDVCFARVKDL